MTISLTTMVSKLPILHPNHYLRPTLLLYYDTTCEENGDMQICIAFNFQSLKTSLNPMMMLQNPTVRVFIGSLSLRTSLSS